MPFGSVVVTTVGNVTTVIDSGCAGEVFPALSFTVTLNEAAPAALGVPLMMPEEAARLKPAGSAPLLTVQLL